MADIQRGPQSARSGDYSQRRFVDWACCPQLARKTSVSASSLYLDADEPRSESRNAAESGEIRL
jgi:hypothetical protein